MGGLGLRWVVWDLAGWVWVENLRDAHSPLLVILVHAHLLERAFRQSLLSYLRHSFDHGVGLHTP